MKGATHKSQHRRRPGIRLVAAAIALALGTSFAYAASEYETGLKLFRAGQYKTARIELKNLVQERPDHVSGRILLGRTELRLGNPGASEEHVLKAIADGAHPTVAEPLLARALFLQGKFKTLLSRIHGAGHRGRSAETIWTLRGRAHLRLGELGQAQSAFSTAIEAVARTVPARAGLATVALRRGDINTAHRWVDEALRLEPEDVESLTIAATLSRKRGDTEKALQLLDRAIEQSPDSVTARLERSLARVQKEDLEGALVDLEVIRKRFPYEPQTLYVYSRVLSLIGRTKDADEALAMAGTVLLSRGADYLDQFPEGRYLAGLVNFMHGDVEEATNHLQKYLRKFPANVEANLMLARIHLERGESAESIRLLETALERHPNEPEALAVIAEAYRQNGQPKKSVAALQRAVGQRPDASGLRARYGFGLLRIGEVDDGLGLLTRVLNENADDINTALNLGYFYAAKNDFNMATAVALKVLDRQPGQLVAMNLLGAAAMGLNDLDRARDIFNNALKIDPKFTPARLNLGRMALHLGQVDEAKHEYERALKDSPNHPTAMSELATIAYQTGDIEGAIKWLLDVVANDSNSLQEKLRLGTYFVEAKRVDEAKALAAQLRDQFPDNLKVLALVAQTEVAEKRIAAARITLSEMSRYAGSRSKELLSIAKLQRQIGDFESASYSLDKAVRANPDFANAIAEMVSLEIQRRRFDRAFELIESLEKLPMRYAPAASTLRGDALSSLDKHSEALAAYEKAFTLEPSSQLVSRISGTYERLGKYEKSADFLDQWLAEHPRDIRVLQVAGARALRSRDGARAKLHFERLLEMTPSSLALLNNLALTYLMLGDERALPFARAAHRVAPKSPAVLDTLGQVLVADGQAAEGLGHLREARSRAPTHLKIAENLAAALQDLGRGQEAIAVLEETLSQDPGNKRLQVLLEKTRAKLARD